MLLTLPGMAEHAEGQYRPAIPKTWDDAAIATIELPLAVPAG
jgi:hypothetical protein